MSADGSFTDAAGNYWSDAATMLHGDCLEVMATMSDNSLDAIVTDPPYGLGFMGKAWDDLPPGLPWAQECLRVLKPGGHLLAFGGTRTWHRLACAIEDAGFEMRDSIAWLYGSGFPKSLDVSKAIDKLDATGERRERALTFTAWMREAGMTARQVNDLTGTAMGSHYITANEQPSIATADLFDLLRPHLPPVPEHIEALVTQRTVESKNYAARAVIGERTTGLGTGKGAVAYIADSDNRDVTAAHTDAARQWQGWGTALKPAFEPVVVARKPLVGTVAQNVLAYGTGAINVDAGRIGTEAHTYRPAGTTRNGGMVRVPVDKIGTSGEQVTVSGRWPANVVLDSESAAELDQQSGTTDSRRIEKPSESTPNAKTWAGGPLNAPRPARGFTDSGGASRFFLTAEPDAPNENLGTVLERFGATPWRYAAKAPKSERPVVDGVAHPTVKPLSIMRWLVRTFTPPGGLVLDPFAGSGTTVEAAMLEGFRVVGIERGTEYLPLILTRIERARA